MKTCLDCGVEITSRRKRCEGCAKEAQRFACRVASKRRYDAIRPDFLFQQRKARQQKRQQEARCIDCNCQLEFRQRLRCKSCAPTWHSSEARRRGAEYRVRNIEKISIRRSLKRKLRREIDPLFNLIEKTRCRVYQAVRDCAANKVKRFKSVNALGCTWPEFKVWIEGQFSETMSWDAVLDGRIHLDHVAPIASYGPDEIEDAFFYINVAPMWAIDNLRKGATVPEPDYE